MRIPRIVLAGSTSNVGKTSISCAIIYGLKKRGYSVQPFKTGPDYIDPGYLLAVSGNTAHNLDVWLMGKDHLLEVFTGNSKCDISLIEGVMGYYDGFSGKNNHASTHHVASITKSNVILVLDAAKAARSIGAIAMGFVKFHKNSRISGIILNKIGSKKHETLCRDALRRLKIPILGVIPNNPELALESRHLGLVPAREDRHLRSKILQIAKNMSAYLDYDQILQIAKSSVPLPKPRHIRAKKPICTIGVALDNSFNFYYSANLDALRNMGARIKFFSPVSDKTPPACDGLYIGGGFPEVLSGPLSRNTAMKKQIKKLAQDDIPLYAECGGLMYLTKSIHDGKRRFPMTALIDANTNMTQKMILNYTKAKVISDCIISEQSGIIQGHEFHYSRLADVSHDTRFAYDLLLGYGITGKKDGVIQNNTLASYGHLFFGGQNFAGTFVSKCLEYSRN